MGITAKCCVLILAFTGVFAIADRKQSEIFYLKTVAKLQRYFLSRGVHRSHLDDAIQDTYLAMLRLPLKKSVLAIQARKVLEIYQTRTELMKGVLVRPSRLPPSIRQDLQSLIQTLSATAQDVLYRSYVEQHTDAQIASSTRIGTTDEVARYRRHVLRKLWVEIGKQGNQQYVMPGCPLHQLSLGHRID